MIITDHVKEQIIGCYMNGENIPNIAYRFGIKRTNVQAVVDEYYEESSDNVEIRKTISDDPLLSYKTEAATAARELGYPRSTLKKISEANTEKEITRIMVMARQNQS